MKFDLETLRGSVSWCFGAVFACARLCGLLICWFVVLLIFSAAENDGDHVEAAQRFLLGEFRQTPPVDGPLLEVLEVRTSFPKGGQLRDVAESMRRLA